MSQATAGAPLIPVILSGGAGSRLWPLSRVMHPKQFIPLAGDRSLFFETVSRVKSLPGAGALRVVCNQEHRFMTAEQLRTSATAGRILLEPEGRNTAPAAAVAALDALKDHPDAILLVLPADHRIADTAAFQAAVAQAVPYASAGHFVVFGVKAGYPETGYGYISPAEPMTADGRPGAGHRVGAFIEKPDAARAETFVSAGYLWNSGVFMFKAARYLEVLERENPAMVDACRRAYAGASHDLDFLRLETGAFGECPSDSIDYAVMEKIHQAVVVPMDAGWTDLGSWQSLWSSEQQDSAGNVLRGDVLCEDSHGCYVNASRRLVATVGVTDLVIVETADAVLVATKARAQDVKRVVDRLKSSGRLEATQHRKVYRPWGAYEVIDGESRFQVKRITVNPGERLSLQMHHHRAEHWIVVSGVARVTRGEEVYLLSENESTFIPLGQKHRLENPGKIPLELIEVQSGSYLGEDDITRFEDNYGRGGRT